MKKSMKRSLKRNSDKNELKKILSVYEKRKNRYRKILSDVNVKIYALKRSIKNTEKKENDFKNLINKTKAYYGSDFTTSVNKKMYKDFFCKFAIEYGIKTPKISKFIGYKYTGTVSYRRKKCIDYFKNPNLKQEWQEYKKYMMI